MSSSLLRRGCIYSSLIFGASGCFVANSFGQGGIFSLGISDDATVRFAWRANSEPNLAGYRLYVGTLPGVYSGVVDVGLGTSFQLTELVRGNRYYFALTAYDAIGLESDFTPELSSQIPLVAINAPATITSSETNTLPEIDVVDEPSPPQISQIPDQWVSKNRAADSIRFTVSDAETPAANLRLIAFSSNPLVVPWSGLILAGSDGNRSLTIDPANGQNGVAIVTIAATDGAASTTVSFEVTVDNGEPASILGGQAFP